jgi:molybdate transport system substrate-binding protein
MRPRAMRRSAAAPACLLACLVALSWAGGRLALAQERPALVAAAADLKFALADIASAFTRETGREVRITYGSSGDLARQLAQGAPFEMLLSADERYVFDLQRAGQTRGEGTLYAVGRLALFAPRGSPLTLDGALRGLQAAVAEGRITRFAIANPQHAPYGRAAREVLQRLGIWERIEPRLVLGENASQAMQFAASGSCQGGIVPLSLASAPGVAELGRIERIPAEWHAPLRQRMVLVSRAGPTAAAFYEYVRSAAGVRQTLTRFGFAVPEGR